MDITFVCISLQECEDRRENIKVLFRELNILDKIIFWIVDRHPNGGTYGCFESHYNIWTTNEIKTKYLCVFEDDLSCFENMKTTCKRFKRLLKFLKQNTVDSDLINLEPGSGYYGNESIFFSKHSCDELKNGFMTKIYLF